ncbi:glutaredoxin family protein [Shewanella canadensis]|uniref:Glutaredoxin family protein n=1 Tax=Shewanella canadensis TaxID=271096 RepID=A0A431WVZ3_9GAMM|nr:glutaredoxin family protein [Shewanella canadensis]RTR39605.1 glutaredoxin family protein [Shewanella canadensis]
MGKTASIILVTIISLLFSVTVFAEVFQWKDSDGNVHFGDQPPISSNVKPVDVILSPTTQLSALTSSTENADSGEPKNSVKKKIVMYATSWCQYCEKARNYFKNNKIRYIEYDVEKLLKRMKEFKKKGGTGYPLILIGKKHKMHGFSASGFERRYKS